MILSLVVALALGVPQDHAIFPRLFPHTSGQNGLEEYIRAGDLLLDSSFRVYQSWQPPDKRPKPEQLRMEEEARKKLLAAMTPEERKQAELDSNHLSEEDQELAVRLNGLNYLQLKTEEVGKYQLPLELMIQGNQKRFEFVLPPSDSDVAGNAKDTGEDIDFEIDRSVRRVARLASDAAFIAFAEGKPTKGVEILGGTLMMAHRLGTGNVVCMLASTGVNSLVMGRFNDNLGSITLADAKRISAFSTSLLDDRNALAEMVKNERRRSAQAWEKGLKSGLLESQKGEEKSPVASQYEHLTPEQRAAWFQQVQLTIKSQFDALTQRFDSPEENWLPAREKETAENADPKDLKQLAGEVTRLFTEGIDGEFMVALMKSRTQLRLLRLHSRIIEFRWQTGRLPSSLDEMKLAHTEIYDPLSRKLFQYSVTNNTYKLTSAGVPETGEIELKYRAPRNLSARDPDRP